MCLVCRNTMNTEYVCYTHRQSHDSRIHRTVGARSSTQEKDPIAKVRRTAALHSWNSSVEEYRTSSRIKHKLTIQTILILHTARQQHDLHSERAISKNVLVKRYNLKLVHWLWEARGLQLEIRFKAGRVPWLVKGTIYAQSHSYTLARISFLFE